MAVHQPRTQYLIPPPPGVEARVFPRRSADLAIQSQKSRFDILPCTLDLPAGLLPTWLVQRQLAFYALFADRIIIPDGWAHCKGPLSEYVRRVYRMAKLQNPSDPACAEATADDLFLN